MHYFKKSYVDAVHKLKDDAIEISIKSTEFLLRVRVDIFIRENNIEEK